MDAHNTFRHGDYDLQCTAQADDRGLFVPNVVVCKHHWPRRPRIIAVPRGDYLSEATALDAARAQAIEWVVNYG